MLCFMVQFWGLSNFLFTDVNTGPLMLCWLEFICKEFAHSISSNYVQYCKQFSYTIGGLNYTVVFISQLCLFFQVVLVQEYPNNQKGYVPERVFEYKIFGFWNYFFHKNAVLINEDKVTRAFLTSNDYLLFLKKSMIKHIIIFSCVRY